MLGKLRTRLLQRASRIALPAAAADAHRGPAPQLAGTIEFETSFGTLYLDETIRSSRRA